MFSLEITKDYQELSEKAAELVAKQLKKKANSVLGLATGSTPLGCYEQLVKLYKAGELDFSEVHSVNLDEYRGLAAEDKNSYRHFMDENLFSKINIVKEHTHVPDGMEENREKATTQRSSLSERSISRSSGSASTGTSDLTSLRTLSRRGQTA